MRYKNTLAIAKISVSIYPHLQGAKAGKWLTVILKWRRNDLCLFKKFCLQKPTFREVGFAAFLAEKLTEEHQAQYEKELRLFTTNRMTEYAYQALPLGR